MTEAALVISASAHNSQEQGSWTRAASCLRSLTVRNRNGCLFRDLNSCLPQRLPCPLIPIPLCQTVELPLLLRRRKALAGNRSSWKWRRRSAKQGCVSPWLAHHCYSVAFPRILLCVFCFSEQTLFLSGLVENRKKKNLVSCRSTFCVRLFVLGEVRKFTCLEAAKSTAWLSLVTDVRMALLSSSTLEREKEFDILPTVLCPEPDGSLNSIGCRACEAFICVGHDAAVAACFFFF